MNKIAKRKSREGQTMVEYIIIVVVIAVAAIAIFGIFGDAIREKVSGATSSISSEKGSEAQAEADKSSKDLLKELNATGID